MAGHRRLIAQECRSCRWQSSLPKSPLVLRQVTHKANPLSPLQQIPQVYINTSNMSRTRICWNMLEHFRGRWGNMGYTGIILGFIQKAPAPCLQSRQVGALRPGAKHDSCGILASCGHLRIVATAGQDYGVTRGKF